MYAGLAMQVWLSLLAGLAHASRAPASGGELRAFVGVQAIFLLVGALEAGSVEAGPNDQRAIWTLARTYGRWMSVGAILFYGAIILTT